MRHRPPWEKHHTKIPMNHGILFVEEKNSPIFRRQWFQKFPCYQRLLKHHPPTSPFPKQPVTSLLCPPFFWGWPKSNKNNGKPTWSRPCHGEPSRHHVTTRHLFVKLFRWLFAFNPESLVGDRAVQESVGISHHTHDGFMGLVSLPTFGWYLWEMLGKYTIHGSYGI